MAGLNLFLFCRYGKAAANAYVQGILTSEPRDLSLLFFLWYLHSGGGKTHLQLEESKRPSQFWPTS